jgi:Protein of unknown function (DUF2721)
MPSPQLGELIPVLQVAIAPVILISGVGLLLLSLTNRFGRAVDLSRELMREGRRAGEEDRAHLAQEVQILYRRARLIQIAIILAAMSVLFASLLILGLFFAEILRVHATVTLSLLFVGCLTTLILSLVAFIVDIHWSLGALKVEFGRGPDGSAV